MFKNKKIEEKLVVEKAYLENKEIELNKRRKLLEIDEEVNNYRKDAQKAMHELAIQCAKDTKAYEHEYHSKREVLNVEIAKLEVLKETMEKGITSYKIQLDGKDKEIERLNNIVEQLIRRNY